MNDMSIVRHPTYFCLFYSALTSATLLAACGGGGDGSDSGASVTTSPSQTSVASAPVGGAFGAVSCDTTDMMKYLRKDITSYPGSIEQAACNSIPVADQTSPAIMMDLVIFDENGQPLNVSIDNTTFSEATTGAAQAFFYRSGYKVNSAGAAGNYSAFLAFDQSGSIAQTDPSNVRVTAGQQFLKTNALPDDVGVGSFSDGAVRYFPASNANGYFTATSTDFIPTLESFKNTVSGDTPLYDAVSTFSSLARSKGTQSRRAVVLFSDGQDTASKSSIDSAIASANQLDVRVFTFALDSPDQNLSALQRIAQETGGAFLYASQANQLIAMYGSLGNLLRGAAPFYRTFWSLKVTPMTAPNCFSANQTAGIYTCNVRANIIVKTSKGPLTIAITYRHTYRVA